MKTDPQSQIAKDAANALPFSITPDAEDFLRDRIKETPPDARPALMLVTSQNDGLKSPRWSYEGESFVIGYFDDDEQPKTDCKEYRMFGRRVAIDPNALKQLSGRVLGLCRVDAKYGLIKNTRYVMVADSTAESPADTLSAANNDKMRRVFFSQP